jgi:hypothetical protein
VLYGLYTLVTTHFDNEGRLSSAWREALCVAEAEALFEQMGRHVHPLTGPRLAPTSRTPMGTTTRVDLADGDPGLDGGAVVTTVIRFRARRWCSSVGG